MADAITGASNELDNTKRELISAAVQRELAFKAKLSGDITDVSMFAEKGAKSISFPKLSSFTAIDRAEGAAGDSTVLTDSVDTLLLDKNAYVSWIIDSMSAIQTSISSQIEFATRAASAHGRFVDTAIITEAETVGVATTTASALITRDIVLEMQEDMINRGADLDMATFWVGPNQRTALLKIDEFTRTDAYGSSAIPSGVLGRLFGVPVKIHRGLGAAQYFLVEKAGIALGFQKSVSMDDQPANEFGVGARRNAMDCLFGIKGQQLGEEGVAGTESALVAKDNN